MQNKRLPRLTYILLRCTLTDAIDKSRTGGTNVIEEIIRCDGLTEFAIMSGVRAGYEIVL